MKRILLVGLLFTFCQLTFAQKTPETEKKDFSKEEKPSFVIKIDGKEYTVKEGEEIEVETEKGKSKVSVKLADEKQFDNGTYRFKYKNHFAYEYEGEPGYKNWTLDGSNCTIMMFELSPDATLDMFSQQMVNQFGEENCKTTKTTRKFGKKKLNGSKIEVALVGQAMFLYMYEIDMDDDKRHIIAIQDMLDENDKPTKEASDAMDLIDKTIEY